MQQSAPSSTSKTKKLSRTVFAGVMSVGLLGTFAFPAFAAAQPEAQAFAAVQPGSNAQGDVLEPMVPEQQTLTAFEAPAPMVATTSSQAVTIEDDQAVLAREAEELERQEAEELEAATEEEPAQETLASVPSGAYASSLASAAAAQVGVYQDCTDLVQNALAAIGLDTRRDQGGYDRGPWHRDWAAFGTAVSPSDIREGDILVWEGAHVAVALGGGMAVHGGVGPGGLGTAILPVSAAFAGPVPTSVIRPN